MMKKHIRYTFALAVAGGAYLAFIPILGLYGVHICPILRNRGFSFGCKYTASFISFVILASSVFSTLLWVLLRSFGKPRVGLKIYLLFPSLSFLLNLLAFAVGIHLLNSYFISIDVPGPSMERMRTAIFYGAILIALLEAQIFDWLTQSWVREQPYERPNPQSEVKTHFFLRWVFDSMGKSAPILGAVVIEGVFLFRNLNELLEVEKVDSDVLRILFRETGQVTVFLMAWVCLVRLFSFLKEQQLVKGIYAHLQALGQSSTEYYSTTIGSGFWEGIFKALNRTTALLVQQGKLIRGFSSFVTKTVVEQVLQQSHDLKAEGTLRNLTVIMSDLRDFTLMSNSLSAEQVVQILNLYFADMIEVLTRYDIVLDKFIGDGILAYIEPKSGDLNESNQIAEQAAIAMHLKLVETNKQLRTLGLPELKMGVAIHCGEVVLGNIGTPTKLQHTIIGDVVNTVSRIEGFCKQYQAGVVVSPRVLESLEASARKKFKDFGMQSIRGLGNQIRIFGVLLEDLL